jgi:uncharacterized membrane protein YccF (DUF307 family)
MRQHSLLARDTVSFLPGEGTIQRQEARIGNYVCVEADIQGESSSTEPQPRTARTSIKHWAGYGWFMSFGTFLPLIVFLCSYLVHLTLVGAPIARSANGLGIWLSTFGQEPPGKDKLASRQQDTDKKSIVERIRPYSPPGIIERRGRPFSLWQRALWFVLVGWWLGAIWVVLAWSVFLMPYPFLDTVRGLLDELPSVMTLAVPEHAGHGQGDVTAV